MNKAHFARQAAIARIPLAWCFLLVASMAHAQPAYEADAGVQPVAQLRAKHKVSNLTFRPGGAAERAGVAEVDFEDEMQAGNSQSGQAQDLVP